MDHPYLFLDTETATLRGAPHLLELAAVRVIGGEVVDTFESLVAPLVPIEPGASAYHGIQNEDVREAPTTSEVLEGFAAWADEDRMVAHDARADLHVLAFEFARHDLTPPAGLVYDTLSMSRRAFPDAPDHKLSTLVELLELDVDAEHRALPDAVACWQLFEACLESVDEDQRGALLERASLSSNLRTALPRVPRRRPSIVRKLERARNGGENVRILYGSDDSSMARIEVLPRLIYQATERAYLEGECQRSGELKTYRLDRIHRVEDARN